MKKILLLLFFISAHAASTAQTRQDTVALIEKIFELYKPANPGCQLAVSRNGQVIFSRAWGTADLEHQVPLTTKSVIEAGSVSKQFTAAAILLLEQSGILSLHDDVRKYVPELPDYGTPITLQQLMQHTSGLKDWGSIMALSDWPRSTKTYSNRDVLYILSHQPSLNHRPGDEYLYSNSNYVLLAIITERVSGKSLAEFTRSAIFEPAGMTHTQWRSDLKKVVLNRAVAYGKNEDGYFTDMPNENVYGNGGLLTTAEDLLRWNRYYVTGKLGNPSLLARQLSVKPLNGGQANTYAAGLRVDSLRGWLSITHDGATAGYRSILEYYPELDLSIAWLANTAEFDGMHDGTAELRNLLIEDKSVKRVYQNPEPITLAAEKLKRYTGWYRDILTGNGLLLTVKDNQLTANKGGILTPIAEDEFMQGQARLEVLGGPRKRLRLSGGSRTIVYEAVAPAMENPQVLKEYTGEYYSDQTDARLTVGLSEGRLIIHRYSGADYGLIPTYKDGFAIQNSSVIVHFERNKSGAITMLNFTTARVRNIGFKKIR
ncbi:D-aminopeptidase [Dyadobacter sp. CECT 9275]|uniref:D-aminopeptidase n=1 Tax=Dyadobacter helix TaxID=2822344 RepID=A0A916N8P9_9BACT|nr:serine hydrolase domain-containing protein [Dyadobacter sp. CECT 9275]CAG5017680.1 D-aminopeptidase [Dyadobacter sp. CECT 9275]